MLSSIWSEVAFCARRTADLGSAARLLRNTMRFHLSNRSRHFAAGDQPFEAGVRVGRDAEAVLRLRPEAGDLFVLYEVLQREAYSIPASWLAPERVRTIVDCGANVGITALYYASQYPDATIYAVEPHPGNFALLARNTASVPRIVPVNAAVVGAARESVRFSTHRKAWGNAVVDGEGGVEAAATTLDELCSAHAIADIDLLKVDIEGGEVELFSQGDFLPRVGFGIIELHYDYDRARFDRDLAPWGFRSRAPRPDLGAKMVTFAPVGPGEPASPPSR